MGLGNRFARTGACILAVALLCALASSSAHAIALPFDGLHDFGFDNSQLSLSPDGDIDGATTPWLAAGDRQIVGSDQFSVVFDQVAVYTPLAGGDFEVQTTLTIENQTAKTIPLAWVFFSTLAPGDPYAPADVAIEIPGTQLSIIRYTQNSDEFFFAGYAIRDFAPGAGGSVTRDVKFVVNGPLINNRTPQVGAGAFLVPEPATGSLVALGLIALAAARRGRVRSCS